MRIVKTIALCLAALALPASGQSPRAPAPAAPLAPVGVTTPAPSAGAQLTATDVDSWLDGLMPYGIESGGIAGVVVVVVKDGKVLTQRGFGKADVKTGKRVDPAATLFRPGSVSKLFTWTAVMQQVQAGKLDLDKDVNAYLDFTIPPAYGKPITLRNLMTHTSGFEETAKYLITTRPEDNRPLDAVLKRWVPHRIYAPGSTASYSNYGASLAGYLVERVSGEKFDDYVQRHILAPLGMRHSSFAQPLPPVLAAGMARGYAVASGEPQKFEIIPMSPAGALSSTGADMAQFMIAHLAQGGPLLSPQTAALMHATANTPIPGLPGMALGFYHEDRNGLNIVGHGGDTNWFHSDLHLYLDKNVGLFVSFNSSGKAGAAHTLRGKLFEGFTDRYFPQPAPELPTLATAAEHGRLLVGHYVSSRGSLTNWLRIATLLGEATVVLNDDRTITVSALRDAAGAPKRWREVAPWQWQEVGGTDRLGVQVKDGKVVALAPEGMAAIILFLPASTTLNAGWIVPALLAALAVMLVTALSWPVVALVRRRYGYRPSIAGRPLMLHRATRITAWIAVIVAAGWMTLIGVLSSDISALDGRLDIWMRLLQVLTLVAVAGTVLTLWNVLTMARSPERKRLATGWTLLVAVSAVYLVWLAFSLRTMTLGLNF
ncbi:MAG: serine hydrolase domain-containing protein [Pseudomonadota bacterium]|jgi:CubicO group peptidase (beta-lactamase class C family)|uniref:Beta-lactamase n=1 Tax=hydrothermal vent metagenome TaxID=652676 RepID=A0A160TMA4_9ZZZZ